MGCSGRVNPVPKRIVIGIGPGDRPGCIRCIGESIGSWIGADRGAQTEDVEDRNVRVAIQRRRERRVHLGRKLRRQRRCQGSLSRDGGGNAEVWRVPNDDMLGSTRFQFVCNRGYVARE